MLVPLSWLRDFAPFGSDARALAEVLDDLGMVVESVTPVGRGLDGVVVGRVRDIAAIAGADKIRRVLVDTGRPEPAQVVCGAWNFAVGDTVALATVGAVLPGDFVITQRKMKGVASDGMLCSANELGLGDDAAGIMILPGSLEPGAPFGPAVGILPDVIYDLAIEGNRPDAMCMAGVARDAAARLGLPFAIVDPPTPAKAGTSPTVSVDVRAPDLCARFTAASLDGVTVGASPAWIARRLTLAGMRPINSVVDASNYVMLELGQPTHPYDLDLLPGAGFVVRAAEPGEQLVTLDGTVRTLGRGDYPDCLICDAGGSVVGIAGIMGGASSEISPSSRRVVLETAHFNPMAIARTSKRLSLRSEASHRFERGVDIEGADRAARRFCELLKLTSPEVRLSGPVVDVKAPGSGGRLTVSLRTTRVNGVLGTKLSAGEITALLEPIGFGVVVGASGVHTVDVPSFRPDVTREIDLVEEVARHHGYSRIQRTVPASPYVGRLTPYQSSRRFVRSVLAGAGFDEAVCAQLLGPGDHARAGLAEDAISAVDPLVREESLLRTSLLPGMLRAAAFNADRRQGDLGMFEIGHTFRRPSGEVVAELPDEREMLGIILTGAGVSGMGTGASGAVSALRRLAGALHLASLAITAVAGVAGMHPSRTARVTVGGVGVGHVGEVDPDVSAAWAIEGRVGWCELDLGVVLEAPRASELARVVSRFPSADIDLAFVVPDTVPAADVEETLARAAGDLLEALILFDVYRGQGLPEGSRSLGFRLRFCALDRTLTDPEVGGLRAACIEAVESAHGARLRA
jgi:phenylalanyl-tRNA synthetase beta chain